MVAHFGLGATIALFFIAKCLLQAGNVYKFIHYGIYCQT